MARVFIVAGPPASGKTIFIKTLKNPHPSWRFLTASHFDLLPFFLSEKEIEENLKKDKELIRKLDPKKNTVVENSLFNAVFYHRFLKAETAKDFFNQAYKKYQKLNPLIIFFDTKPEISWRRQQKVFLDELKKQNINQEKEINHYLTLYQKTLFDLYPLWFNYLDKLSFEKIVIRNSYINEEEFIRQAFILFQKSLLNFD